MHIPKSVIPTAVVAVALGLASPVLAQHRRGGGDGGHSSVRIAVRKATPGDAASGAAARVEAGPRASSAPAPAQRSDNGARRDVWAGSQPRAQGTAVPRVVSPSVRNGGAYRNDAYRVTAGIGTTGIPTTGIATIRTAATAATTAMRRSISITRTIRSVRASASGSDCGWATRCRTRTRITTRSSTVRTATVTRRRYTRRTRTRPARTRPARTRRIRPRRLIRSRRSPTRDRAGSELDRRSAGAGESRRPEFRHHAARRSGAGGR